MVNHLTSNNQILQPFEEDEDIRQNSSVEEEHEQHNQHHMRNTRVLQLPICFDDYDQEEEEEAAIERSDDNNNAGNEEVKEGQTQDDEEIDHLFINTDEKLNTTAAEEYFKSDFQQSRNRHGDLTSYTMDSQTQATIALGPNLNMQVNAIGSMRRRKRAGKDNDHKKNNNRATATAGVNLTHQNDGGDNEEDIGDTAPQYKKLNNSNIMPLKYSRYVNDN